MRKDTTELDYLLGKDVTIKSHYLAESFDEVCGGYSTRRRPTGIFKENTPNLANKKKHKKNSRKKSKVRANKSKVHGFVKDISVDGQKVMVEVSKKDLCFMSRIRDGFHSHCVFPSNTRVIEVKEEQKSDEGRMEASNKAVDQPKTLREVFNNDNVYDCFVKNKHIDITDATFNEDAFFKNLATYWSSPCDLAPRVSCANDTTGLLVIPKSHWMAIHLDDLDVRLDTNIEQRAMRRRIKDRLNSDELCLDGFDVRLEVDIENKVIDVSISPC